MVNDAIRKMVIELFDEDTWEDLCVKAKNEELSFELFKQYDDAITLNLVVAICEATQKDAPEILESFGEYWIGYAFESEYRDLLGSFATDPIELIKSLNNLHDRLEMSFDQLKPPSFDIVEERESSIIVNYYTERDMPLEYFVVGLMKGIFKHFKRSCDLEIIENTLGDAKATFELRYDG